MRVIIIIDDREERVSSLIPELEKLLLSKNPKLQFVFRIRRIEQGDLIILTETTATIIELKRDKDFFDSLYDGRLFFQANKIQGTDYVFSQKVMKKILIVYGSLLRASLFRNKESSKLLDSAFSAIMSLTFRWGIYVFFVENKEGLLLFLARLIIREALGSNEGGSPLVITRNNNSLRPEVALVANIPNIGVKKAHLLLEKYGSPLRIFLDPDPHLKIKGIGKKVSDSIKKFVWINDVPVKLQDNPLVFGLFEKKVKEMEHESK